MTTFMFEVKNIPAALYKALGGFATNGVNMTKLESYQTGDSFAATKFYADIVGAPGDERIDRALDELDFQTKSLRLLGTYAQARTRQIGRASCRDRGGQYGSDSGVAGLVKKKKTTAQQGT